MPKTWAEHKSTLPTKQHCFLGRPARRGSLSHGLFLGGDSVQDHLDAGLAAQGGVDGQIIVVGIAPAVLGRETCVKMILDAAAAKEKTLG